MSGMTRDRAIEILRDNASGASLWELAEAVDMAIEALKRQHGEWVLDQEFSFVFNMYECSKCRFNGSKRWRFCPNCGADMRPKGGETEWKSEV